MLTIKPYLPAYDPGAPSLTLQGTNSSFIVTETPQI
jgi:hypothetical protein